jgi:UDP:flavonoid glycosyltransferase YjiC (YdhE family)
LAKLPPRHIAFFISPHGFGHAARACAVMAALREIEPTIHFEIFTRVPRWFFDDSLDGSFTYHSLLTDIGLVQETALREHIGKTVESLNRFLPFTPRLIDRLARYVTRLKCEMILCDIAPLGIAVGKAAGLPSVLIENFTWDWIYQAYTRADGRIKDHAAYLGKVFRAADYHIQTEPICFRRSADLRTSPVSREPRTSRAQTREKLGIPRRAKAVLITMGGIPGEYEFLHQLEAERGVYFVIPGSGAAARRRGNLVLLPHRSEFFHPDLVAACDAVIGKLGYSTVAEAYHAGVPLAYVARPRFRESKIVARFVHAQMQGLEIPQAAFQNGDWLRRLPDLLALPRIRRNGTNGAQQAATHIAGLLK